MAVKIRLKRFGTKKRPYYRIVVADGRTQRDGKVLEEIGMYNPLTDPATVEVDQDKAVDYIMKGAQPTNTVKNLFRKQGVMQKVHEAKNTTK